jgi:hypothetical protein
MISADTARASFVDIIDFAAIDSRIVSEFTRPTPPEIVRGAGARMTPMANGALSSSSRKIEPANVAGSIPREKTKKSPR